MKQTARYNRLVQASTVTRQRGFTRYIPDFDSRFYKASIGKSSLEKTDVAP